MTQLTMSSRVVGAWEVGRYEFMVMPGQFVRVVDGAEVADDVAVIVQTRAGSVRPYRMAIPCGIASEVGECLQQVVAAWAESRAAPAEGR